MEWTQDRLKLLCSTAALAYLQPAINTTRLQDPIHCFENRVKILIGDKNPAQGVVEEIRSAVNLNSGKRSVTDSLRDCKIWEENVVTVLYNSLKFELTMNTTQKLSSLQQRLKSIIVLTIEIEKSKMQNYQVECGWSNRIDLFLKMGPYTYGYKCKFKLPADILSELELIDLTTCFVGQGAKYLEDKVSWYEAVSTGQKKKAGKWANAIGETFGASIGATACFLAGTSTTIGSKVGGGLSNPILSKFDEAKYQEKATSIIKYFGSYGVYSFRKMSIDVFINIFQIYEYQFSQVKAKSENGWETYIKRLSLEIGDRIFNHISKPENQDLFKNRKWKPVETRDSDISKLKAFLVHAGVHGPSKSSFTTEVLPKSVANPFMGFEIMELGWRSFELFEYPGIIEQGSLNYPEKLSCSPEKTSQAIQKYGCRLMTDFERFSPEEYINKTELFLRTHYSRIIPDDSLKNILAFEYRLGTDVDVAYISDRVRKVLIESSEICMLIETRNDIGKLVLGVEELKVGHNKLESKIDVLFGKKLPNIPAPLLFELPPAGSVLYGRDADLERVHSSLNPTPLSAARNKDINSDICSSVTVISGLGGIGKTQLALEYSVRYSEEYGGNIIWINGSTDTSIKEAFIRLGRFLGIEAQPGSSTSSISTSDLISTVSLVYTALANQNFLIVFDNVENETEEDYTGQRFLYKFLPSQITTEYKQHFLVTSRLSNWDRQMDVITLEELSPDQSKQLILESCSTGGATEDAAGAEKDALDLGIRLQGLPLALQQAVAYINQVNKELEITGSYYTIGNYLHEIIEENGKVEEFLKHDLPSESYLSNYQKTVCTTWLVTLKRLSKSPESLRILYCMSFMLPDKIPTNWFVNILVGPRLSLGSCLQLLSNYSLISVNRQDCVVSIHRILQDVIRLFLKPGVERDTSLNDCFKILQNQIKKPLSDSEKLECISHLETVWNYAIIGRNWDVCSNYREFALDCAKQLFDFDRLYSCLNFCQSMHELVQSVEKDSEIGTETEPVERSITSSIPQNARDDITDLITKVQYKLLKDVQVPRRETQLRFREFDWNKHDEDFGRDILTNLCKSLVVPNPKNPEIHEHLHYISHAVFSGRVEPEFVSVPKEPLGSNVNGYDLVVFNDMFTLMAWAMFPVFISYEYCEQTLQSAIRVFEYVNERFRAQLKSKPLLQILLLECTSFCWFKLSARLAAIEPLRRCIRIYQAESIEENKVLTKISRAVGFLRTNENSPDVENILRNLIGILEGANAFMSFRHKIDSICNPTNRD